MFHTAELAGGRVFRHARARPLDRRAEPGRPAAPAGPGAAARRQDVVPDRPQRAAVARRPAKKPSAASLPVIERFASEGGGTAIGVAEPEVDTTHADGRAPITNGSVVIAAITSCTNTSNPSVMVAAGPAGQEGRRARAEDQALGQGQPGARLEGRHRLPPRRRARHVPRPAPVQPGRLRLHDLHRQLGPACRRRSPRRSTNDDLVAVAVLSGNRNFEGRINPDVRANYLASPPLVVAYALAGTMDIDLQNEPLGNDPQGQPGLLEGHLAQPARDPGHDPEVGSLGDVPDQVRRGLRGRRALELAAGARGRPLRVGPERRRTSRTRRISST